jgi:hypothetical protein
VNRERRCRIGRFVRCEHDVAEIRRGGAVPQGEDSDLVPGHVLPQMHDEASVLVGLVEGMVGDDKPGGEVSEIGCYRAPPMDVGAGQHVELGDPERAIVEYGKDASELVLGHCELVPEVAERGSFGAIPTRIRIAEKEIEIEAEKKP